jgi:hypothetical protein
MAAFHDCLLLFGGMSRFEEGPVQGIDDAQ